MTAFDSFAGAASDLFSAKADRFKADASRTQAQASRVAGQADLIKSKGDLLEGEQYGKAAGFADENAAFTAQSVAIQKAQADRQLFGVMGLQRADIAASGFAEGGSGGDILRDSASQGALNRAVLEQQGLITGAGYKEQADSYRTMQTAAGFASQQDILASQGQELAAKVHEDTAKAYEEAATGSEISAVIKAVGGVFDVATAFIPKPPSVPGSGAGLPDNQFSGFDYAAP